jgi:flavin-dependent dehydrogenase
MPVVDVDYLIIGAGLAGLTVHHFLEGAARIAIVDPRPGRYKLGESLVPEHFRDPALEPLLNEVQRLPSASPKRGSIYVGDDSVAAFPLPPADYPNAVHLRREELETRMAALWKTPIERERVNRVDLDQGLVHTNVRTWRVARQIIDCSGPARIVARARGDDHELWPSFSSWMYFDIRRVDEEKFAESLRKTGRSYARFDAGVGRRLPAAEYDGWSPSNCTIVNRTGDGKFAWQIPLYQKSVLSFGVTSRHGPISREDLLEMARTSIAGCYDVSPRPFDGSSEYNRFHVYNHFSRSATQVASQRWILVGDAASFGEPIYATGTAVAVNQALFIARSLRDGGWTRDKAEDYAARWQRLVGGSLQARRYFFQPPDRDESAAGNGLFHDRGLEGTPFQLTMANNYGLILAGLKEFVSVDEAFGSKFRGTAEDFQRASQSVLALLAGVPGGLGRWTMRSAYDSQNGLQIEWSHVSLPDLVVRVEVIVPGRRYFSEEDGLGLAYMSLPDRPYPLVPDLVQLLETITNSLRERRISWAELLHIGRSAERRLAGLFQEGMRLQLDAFRPQRWSDRLPGTAALIEIDDVRSGNPIGSLLFSPASAETPDEALTGNGLVCDVRLYRGMEASEPVLVDAARALLSVATPADTADMDTFERRARETLPTEGATWAISRAPLAAALEEPPIAAQYRRPSDGTSFWVMAQARRDPRAHEAPFVRTRYVDLDYFLGLRDPEEGALRAAASILDQVRAVAAEAGTLPEALATCHTALAEPQLVPAGWERVAVRRMAPNRWAYDPIDSVDWDTPIEPEPNGRMGWPAGTSVEAPVSRTLPGLSADVAAEFVHVVQLAGVHMEQLEASIRFDGARVVRGGRMMIQRAPSQLAAELSVVLGIQQAKEMGRIGQIADAEGVLSIVGWDFSTSHAIVKLYVNASDAAETVRTRLAGKLGLAALLPPNMGPPHVFGFNFHATGCETKAYWQSSGVETNVTRFGPQAVSLASQFGAVCAGSVVSFDLTPGGFEPRAFFVATRHSGGVHARALCGQLTGWSDGAVDAALPFMPGPLRSIGVSFRDPRSWTAYFRPRVNDGEQLVLLSPTVCLRNGQAEIGLFVEPVSEGGRAATRTSRHALSYRIREGAISGPAIDSVLQWATQRVEIAEREDAPLASLLTAPPAPWMLVQPSGW